MFKRLVSCLCVAALTLAVTPSISFADGENEQIYYIGSVENAGLDTGYNENNEISRDDWHFGWSLGQFTISGYTGETENAQGYPVFLKTTDDKIKLSFRLDQDLDALNGNENLSLNADTDGYNQHFGIGRTDFGRGTLIIRQTNYQNATGEPQIYTNYLEGVEKGADTEVVLLEEGNYEVQLDYELRNDPRKVGPVSLVPEYANYKIDFYFEVRNGNCMVFPFDLLTKSELANEAYAPNGFYLDLAKSRYLDINVKKELLSAGANGLVEDTRFNGPARDGEEYTEEGIYTITVSNPSTGQETVKKICVGNDPVLKCYAMTGVPIETINARLAEGDTISDEGMLVTPEQTSAAGFGTEGTEVTDSESDDSPVILVALFAAAALVLIVALALVRKRKRLTLPNGTNQLKAVQEPKLLDNGEDEKK